MFRISRLHEMMKALPRGAFDRIVSNHAGNKHSKGFSCWDQLLVMVYGQLAGASSLRTLEAGFNSQRTHHYHLGTGPVRRSTLADANSRRKADIFADTVRLLMAKAKRTLRREGEDLLYLLDSTSLTLKGPGFDTWTRDNRTCHTQGIKLHVLYDGHSQVPLHHSFTAANVNDVEEGAKLPIEPGAVYVFDKGYCDYTWWNAINEQGAVFVTRFKKNAALRVESTLPIPAEDAAEISHDECVRFSNRHPGGGRKNPYEKVLRRITVTRPGRNPLVLATNDLTSPAIVIARRYKDRWGIELFFKWIKQHLKIKTFLGRSETAVRIQVLTALIAYLLLALYREAHAIKHSLWNFLTEVRSTLFQRPSLEAHRDRRRREALAAFAARQPGLFA